MTDKTEEKLLKEIEESEGDLEIDKKTYLLLILKQHRETKAEYEKKIDDMLMAKDLTMLNSIIQKKIKETKAEMIAKFKELIEDFMENKGYLNFSNETRIWDFKIQEEILQKLECMQ